VNIPLTAESSSQKVTLIRWVADYVEVTGPLGVKGITVWDSDRRLKTSIQASTINALSELTKVSLRSFVWIGDNQFEQCGVIAQEIEEALGEKFVLKVKQEDGSISYQIKEHQFIPLIIKALQELNEKHMRLENEVAILNSKGEATC
jgi:hypothetical protein